MLLEECQKKGTSGPLSSRQIRRLAQQRAEQDLKNMVIIPLPANGNFESETPSSPNDSILKESTHVGCVSSTLVSESEFDFVPEFSEFDVDICTEGTSQQGLLTKDETTNEYDDLSSFDKHHEEEYKETMNIENDDINNDSDSDDESGISLDSFNYSDSDVESIIGDADSDFDLDDILLPIGSSENEEFKNELAIWANTFLINHNALKALLSLINKYTNMNLCKDSRTLMKTPRYTSVIEIDNGECIKQIIQNKCALNHEFQTVNLLINIDGAAILGNSSEKNLWIILCKDAELSTVYLVGVFHGIKKPQDQNNFLKCFVEELIDLINNGFTWDGQVFFVRMHGFVCDTPAKSFILCTKYHSGYFSCSKCTLEGEYLYNGVYFPVKDIEKLKKYCNIHLRSDTEFKNLQYIGDYQRGETILCKLPFVGLVSNVPLDAMHLVYQGVMKHLIRLWIGDKKGKKQIFRLSEQQIEQVSLKLESLKNLLPCEFNRRSRSLAFWKQWKATEYRHFLLYFGPFLLKNVLEHKVYHNFLKLHLSILILNHQNLISNSDNIEYAESLLINFIYEFQEIYGKNNVTHNIHNLLHLAKDVKKYDTLESFSAFDFENHICLLKK